MRWRDRRATRSASPTDTEYAPVGHVINLASRMQTVAPVGGIVVSAETRHLVEGYFKLRDLGPTAKLLRSCRIPAVDSIGRRRPEPRLNPKRTFAKK